MVLAYGAESDRKLGIPGEVGWFYEPVIYHYFSSCCGSSYVLIKLASNVGHSLYVGQILRI